MNQADPLTTQKRPGLLESAVLKLFTRTAHVLDVEEVGGAFRIVTLGGEALRGVGWTPGDKIQIQFGGWVQRTYTPIDWDGEHGRTRILVHLCADGPGTQWARAVRTGDACIVFGPRRSIKPAPPGFSIIVFGDETSMGLAVALSDHGSSPAVHGLFEVQTPVHATSVIGQLRLDHAQVCRRLTNDAHFFELETRMRALLRAHPTAHVMLTGKAGTIQHMSRLLRELDVAAGRRQSKAYWAPGKTGLD